MSGNKIYFQLRSACSISFLFKRTGYIVDQMKNLALHGLRIIPSSSLPLLNYIFILVFIKAL